jgi:hypothetical protein
MHALSTMISSYLMSGCLAATCSAHHRGQAVLVLSLQQHAFHPNYYLRHGCFHKAVLTGCVMGL